MHGVCERNRLNWRSRKYKTTETKKSQCLPGFEEDGINTWVTGFLGQ